MKRLITAGMVILLAACAGTPLVRAQSDQIETHKLAQTGFKFLSVSVDPRAAAMADALTADEVGSAMSMFYNPASMAHLDGRVSVAAGVTQWLAEINYNMAGIAFSPMGGAYGTFGIQLMAVDYGDFIGTVRSDTEQGYEEYDDLGIANPSPTAFVIGVGYARALSDRFSVGGNVKYAMQDLGEVVLSRGDAMETESYDMNALAFDFGVLYKTGFRSLNFAMTARNFSSELKYVNENFEIPLTMNIGVSMDVLDLTNLNQNMHSLRISVDAERPRDFSEQLSVGGEYIFMNTLALRGGYTFPTDEQGVNLGVGLQHKFGTFGFGADYAYTSFGLFDPVHRLAFKIML